MELVRRKRVEAAMPDRAQRDSGPPRGTADRGSEPCAGPRPSAGAADTIDADTIGDQGAGRISVRRAVWYYFLLTYVVLLVNASTYLTHIAYHDVWTVVFAGATYVTYTFIYLLPVLLAVLAVERIGRFTPGRARATPRFTERRWPAYAAAFLGFTFIQYLVFADKTVYGIFGFHLNGFVWNLVFTKGGLESMGGGPSTSALALVVGVGFIVTQAVLFWLVAGTRFGAGIPRRFASRTAIVITACCVTAVAICVQIGYGISSLQGYEPILAAADAFPCFIPTTFAGLAKSFGYKVRRAPALAIDMDSLRLNYPLHAVHRDPSIEPLNIVWLVTESLRADMLTPDVMPNTWALSEQCSRFAHHYSGGNGTRMGMFSMFYGLYGPYWFPFLAERRGPVLIDTLVDSNYQMEVFTGAKFTYPEFDKTVFARLNPEQLHNGGGKPSWRQDERHIDSMIRFIEERDPSRPFMTFMFFESPHANYSFSSKAVIRRPYAEELNYVSMDVGRDIDLIKNRYINACRQVDTQVARIMDCLKNGDLMGSTIILFTGDHGEAFMEKGRWGHNSEFTEEQTRVPLVLWVPRRPARVVARITSHLDIPATLMPLLGVLNPAGDYSQGVDLFAAVGRRFTVISDWSRVAYVDAEFKAVFPMSALAVGRSTVTSADDVPLADRFTFYEEHRDCMVSLMRGLKRFRK